MTDGRWTDGQQKFERSRDQFLHCNLKEHEFRGKESRGKTLMNSEPLLDAQVAVLSKTRTRRKPIQINAERELKDGSESLHKEQKDWIEGT